MSTMTVVYAGSFDPWTKGHDDIVRRAAQIFPQVIVLVANASSKQYWLSVDQRVALINAAGLPSGVSVVAGQGLTALQAKALGAQILVRGVRNGVDMEVELSLAQMNRELVPGLETVFLATSHQFSFVSSTWVREIARAKGDCSSFVPAGAFGLLRQWGLLS